MSQLSQKEAVFSAISSVLSNKGIAYEGVDVATVMTKELRAQVNLILFESFRLKSVKLDREFTDAQLKAYVSGLQSNWIRKDIRLNGGVKFTTKTNISNNE